MSKIVPTAIVLFALSILPASAQNARSFVSAHGSDSAACTLAAPCRTFAVAFGATNASGEIDVLDTAGYGPLTINKAISIVNDGSIASVLVPSGGNGITINAGLNDAVSLRGLSIDGEGAGISGIIFNTGKSLIIDNCVIRHVAQNGIQFAPNAVSSLTVSNTLVADNANDGIFVVPSGSGAVRAVFNRVQVTNNANADLILEGDNSTGTLNATVSESLFAASGAGIWALTASGKAPTTVMVSHSTLINNGGEGLLSTGSGSTIRLANSTVSGNFSGWSVSSSGVLLSYGDNYIDGNSFGETAPPSAATK